MILVADASALIALSACDSLPLIAQIAASPVFIGESLIQTVLDLAGESAAHG